jgi:hypothetical protein
MSKSKFSREQIAKALLLEETGSLEPDASVIYSSSTAAVAMECLGLLKDPEDIEYASTRGGCHLTMPDGDILTVRDLLDMFVSEKPQDDTL